MLREQVQSAHLRFFGARTGGARQNWSKPAISWESNLKTAVGPRISRITGITNIAPSVQSVQSVVNSRSEGNERRTTDYRITRITRIKKGLGCKGCTPGGWPRKRFSTMTKSSQAKGLLHKVRDWLCRLNSNKRSLCVRLAAGRRKDESRFQR